MAIPVVAIIDDDASVRAAIGSLVRSLGYAAQSYASAELFLLSGDLLQTDCIVTDVQMPAGICTSVTMQSVCSRSPESKNSSADA